MIRHPLHVSFFAAGFLLFGAIARADTLLITDVGSGTPDNGVNGIYGLVFLSDTNITVRSVGFYDQGGDGLAAAHRIGFGSGSAADIWPFAQATVPGGTAAALSDGFRWVNLTTPVSLVAGTYYTIAGEMISGTDAMLSNDATDFGLAASITASAARSTSIGATWTEGQNLGNNPQEQSGNIFVVVNFSDELRGLNPIPEPAGFAAFAGAATLALVAGRRRRGKTTDVAGR